MLYVDDDVGVVQQDPTAGRTAFPADRTEVLLDEFLFNTVDDGVDLAFAGC